MGKHIREDILSRVFRLSEGVHRRNSHRWGFVEGTRHLYYVFSEILDWERLARMELFLFTANVFNQMKLRPAYGMLPSDYRKVRGKITCLPYKTEVELRY